MGTLQHGTVHHIAMLTAAMKIHEHTALLSGQALLTLLSAIQERGAACRLCVNGMSMWPNIQHNDIVTIMPLGGLPPCRGEVVVFQHPKTHKPVIHRVVGVSADTYTLKGDNNLFMDGQIPLSHIIGRIVKIERNGRTIFWCDRSRHPWWATRYYHVMPGVSGGLRALGRACMQVVLRGQNSGFYRQCVRYFTRISDDALAYALEIGTRSQCGNVVYQPLAVEELPVLADSPEAIAAVQHCRIVLRLHGRHAAWLTLQGESMDGEMRWSLLDAYIRIRYRGLGLETLLARQSAAMLERTGISTLHLTPALPGELARWVREGYFQASISAVTQFF